MKESVTFGQAFKSYWKNYFNFKGRARRSEVWWMVFWKCIFLIPVIIIGVIFLIKTLFSVSMFVLTLGMTPYISTRDILNIMLNYISIYSVITFIPSFSLMIRRCHDAGVHTVIPLILYLILSIFYLFSRVLIVLTSGLLVYVFFGSLLALVLLILISISALLVPIIFIYFIVIASLDSKKGCNKYGESSKYPSSQYEDEDKLRLI